MKINLKCDYEKIAVGDPTRVLLAVDLLAGKRKPKKDRDPVAFGLVIDRSGSMHGAPLDKAKEAAIRVIQNLRKGDQLAITCFDDQAQVVLPLQEISDRSAAIDQVKRIESGGCTNLSAGWMLCRDELKQGAGAARKKILLLSDGLANSGITEPDSLLDLFVQSYRIHGVRSSSLGFGDGYDEDLLSSLAQGAMGAFYDANLPEDLPGIFTEELEGLQQISVQNLRLRAQPLDFCDKARLLGPQRPIERPNRWFEFSLGDLVSEESQKLFLEIYVLPIPVGADGKPVTSVQGEKLMAIEFLWDELSDKGVKSMTYTQEITVDRVQEAGKVVCNQEIVIQAARSNCRRCPPQGPRGNEAGERRRSPETALRRLEATRGTP
jgi:Ca-activated chloride channel family protein